MCSESRVEFILPDYPKSIIDPPDLDKPKDVYIAGCSKLAIKKPYHGANYSIIFKHKTSLNTLYHVITKIELAKLSDKTITFNFYYSVMKGKKVTMVAEMNDKAIYMVRKSIFTNYSCVHTYAYEFLRRFVKRKK